MHKIRPALPNDLAALIASDPYAQDSAARRGALKAWLEQRAILVAHENSSILGFIACSHTFFGQRFIHLVCVAPSARRRGVATGLVDSVVSSMPRAKLFTSTNASNSEAQRLFEGLRFIRSGVVENLDPNDPEYIYFRPPGISAEA